MAQDSDRLWQLLNTVLKQNSMRIEISGLMRYLSKSFIKIPYHRNWNKSAVSVIYFRCAIRTRIVIIFRFLIINLASQ
jgi:hypothetical protein